MNDLSTPMHTPTPLEVVRILNTSTGKPLYSPVAVRHGNNSISSVPSAQHVGGNNGSPTEALRRHDNRSSPNPRSSNKHHLHPNISTNNEADNNSPYHHHQQQAPSSPPSRIVFDVTPASGISMSPSSATKQHAVPHPSSFSSGNLQDRHYGVTGASSFSAATTANTRLHPSGGGGGLMPPSSSSLNTTPNGDGMRISTRGSGGGGKESAMSITEDQRHAARNIVNGVGSPSSLSRGGGGGSRMHPQPPTPSQLSVDPSQLRQVGGFDSADDEGRFVPNNGIIADAIDEHHSQCEDTVRMLLKEYKAVVQERNLLRMQVKGLEENEAILRDAHERQLADMRRNLGNVKQESERLRDDNTMLVEEKESLRESRERLLQHIEDMEVEKAGLSLKLRHKWDNHLVDDDDEIGGAGNRNDKGDGTNTTRGQAVLVSSTPPTSSQQRSQSHRNHPNVEGNDIMLATSASPPRKGANFNSPQHATPIHQNPLDFSSLSSIRSPQHPQGAREFGLSDVPQHRSHANDSSTSYHQNSSHQLVVPNNTNNYTQQHQVSSFSRQLVVSGQSAGADFSTESLTVDTDRSSVLLSVRPCTQLVFSDDSKSQVLSRHPAVSVTNNRGRSGVQKGSGGGDPRSNFLIDVNQERPLGRNGDGRPITEGSAASRLQPALVLYHGLSGSRGGMGRCRADFTVTSKDPSMVLCGLKSCPFFSVVPKSGNAGVSSTQFHSSAAGALLGSLSQHRNRSAGGDGSPSSMVVQHEFMIVTTMEPKYRRATPTSPHVVQGDVDFYVTRTRMLLLTMVASQFDDIASGATSSMDSLLLRLCEGGSLDEAIMEHRTTHLNGLLSGSSISRQNQGYNQSAVDTYGEDYRQLLLHKQRNVMISGHGHGSGNSAPNGAELLRDGTLFKWFCNSATVVEQDEEEATNPPAVKSVLVPKVVKDTRFSVSKNRGGGGGDAMELAHNHYTIDVLFEEDNVVDMPLPTHHRNEVGGGSLPTTANISFVSAESVDTVMMSGGMNMSQHADQNRKPSFQLTMEWDRPTTSTRCAYDNNNDDVEFEDDIRDGNTNPPQLSIFLNQRHVVSHAFPVSCCTSATRPQSYSDHRITSVQLPDHVVELLAPHHTSSSPHRTGGLGGGRDGGLQACDRLIQAGLKPFVVLPKADDEVSWKV